jgi:hypothetical protein
VAASAIVTLTDWLASLRPGTIITGSGLTAAIEAQLPPGVVVADASQRDPQAATVGRVAYSQYQAGRRDDLWKLAPVYLRPSAAEEKAAKKL